MNATHSQPLLESLTEREEEVLGLMVDGLTNREIADQLVLGIETVRWYTKQIYSKLGVHSRRDATQRAEALGLLDSTSEPETAQVIHNLPEMSKAFFGRERELAELQTFLNDPDIRLVTIAGPGGIGKSRLCIELARTQLANFPGGVYFVPLIAVDSMDGLAPALAHHLSLRLTTESEPDAQLLRFLGNKRILLVLDNLEHLPDAATFLARILDSAPEVKIVATSRASLNLNHEWVRYLEGLSVPDDDAAADGESYGAIKLFNDCARRVNGHFDPAAHRGCVIEICRLVHGTPLAIELAAIWMKTLACEDIVREIRQNVDFLATRQPDVAQRHRSIRAVFECSWGLLDDDERRALRRLSVFRGGFGRMAAERVADASLQILASLVDKSLLFQNEAGLYEVHDLLRQYAEEKLERSADHSPTIKSNILMGWAALLKGDFGRVREIAEHELELTASSDLVSGRTFALAALGVLAGMDENYEDCLQLCETAHAHAQGESFAGLFAALGLAVGYCGLGDYHATWVHIRQALEYAQTFQGPAFLTLCLPVLAVVLAHEAETERAIELLALAFSHPASAPEWMAQWPPLVNLRADLEAELGAAAYADLWRRGTHLEIEPVVAALLADPEG